jgi:hypothetical protein
VLASTTGVYAFQYGSDEIGPLAERWVETARAAGDDWELTQALDLASLPFVVAGDYAAATSLTDEAIAVARRTGSASALCYALFTAGSIRWTMPAEALPYLEQAVVVAEAVGNQLGSGVALGLTAVVLAEQGDWVGAAPYVARSIRNYYRAGDRNGFDQNLQSVALILAGTGDDEGAATVFGTQGHKRHRDLTPWAERVNSTEAALRERLGADTFSRSFDRGAAMSDDELAEFVLDKLATLAQ